MTRKHLFMAVLSLPLLLATACSTDDGDDWPSFNDPDIEKNATVSYMGQWVMTYDENYNPTNVNDSTAIGKPSGSSQGETGKDGKDGSNNGNPPEIDKDEFFSQPTVSSLATYNALKYDLTVAQMPTDLFCHWTGLSQATNISPTTYVTKCHEVGYSSNVMVLTLGWASDASDYVFTCTQDGKEHTVRVCFNESSMLLINTYLRVMTLVLSIDKVYRDDIALVGALGYLTLSAQLQ